MLGIDTSDIARLILYETTNLLINKVNHFIFSDFSLIKIPLRASSTV